MSDLIDRQDAIDVDRNYYDPEDYSTESIEDRLKRLSPVQPEIRYYGQFEIKDPILISEQRWIPCSERLPDIGEHHVSEPCIVYCSNGAYGFAGLEENIFGQVGWNCERDDEYHEPLGEVLAWMPLPEPYKGEQE